jgi:hypothetical protein
MASDAVERLNAKAAASMARRRMFIEETPQAMA